VAGASSPGYSGKTGRERAFPAAARATCGRAITRIRQQLCLGGYMVITLVHYVTDTDQLVGTVYLLPAPSVGLATER
jgi:hypothetical protein